MILNNASFIIQWFIIYKLKDDVGGYTAVITAESFINALATNGFYLNLKEDAKGTVTVDYIAK